MQRKTYQDAFDQGVATIRRGLKMAEPSDARPGRNQQRVKMLMENPAALTNLLKALRAGYEAKGVPTQQADMLAKQDINTFCDKYTVPAPPKEG